MEANHGERVYQGCQGKCLKGTTSYEDNSIGRFSEEKFWMEKGLMPRQEQVKHIRGDRKDHLGAWNGREEEQGERS